VQLKAYKLDVQVKHSVDINISTKQYT